MKIVWQTIIQVVLSAAQTTFDSFEGQYSAAITFLFNLLENSARDELKFQINQWYELF